MQTSAHCEPQSLPSKLESTTYLLWLVEASLHTMVVQSVSNYPVTQKNLEFYQAKKYYFLSVTYRSVTMFNKAYMCPLNPLVYTQKKLKCILITYPCAKLIIITLRHSQSRRRSSDPISGKPSICEIQFVVKWLSLSHLFYSVLYNIIKQK